MTRKRQTRSEGQALDDLQVSLAMAGEARAFQLLYKRWHPRLLRHARGLVGHPDEALDVMQDAAMAIARNIHRLERPESFGPWAYTIVRNRAANHIKQNQRHRSLKKAARTVQDFDQTKAPAIERADQLRELIATLAVIDRDVLSAYYVDGMSVHEIAACLGLPPGTVKSRLHTARTHLKTAYDALERTPL